MAPRPSPQTERLVQLLEFLAAESGAGASLAAISRRLEVHKGSCHSMLSELVRSGWLLRDQQSKTYQLGPALIRLGTAAASKFPALDLARPTMAELTSATGAHCVAFAVSSDHVTVVDQTRNRRDAGHPMALGTELPTRPPYGASLAAWLPPGEQRAWLDGVPDSLRDHYGRALKVSHRRGFAIGLHVLADLRLQELASLVRAAESQRGRLGELATALTEELMTSEEWFPASLSARRVYDVSHLDSPVVGADGRPVLMLSLVPVPSRLSGTDAGRLGRMLAERTAALSEAMVA